ncbi:MAG: deoxyribodipyrimidine photolyase [Gemmataceae bacterium]
MLASRVRTLVDAAPDRRGDYVLYWMQAYRRLSHNHALDYALTQARTLRKPLVVYEGLRADYRWASDRTHRILLEGMVANAATAKVVGVNYWPYAETPDQPARGLLAKLCAKAAFVVTDDYPCFVVPAQIEALARQIDKPFVAIDGNCIVPLALLGAPVAAAAHLRPRIHRLFADAWPHRAANAPDFPRSPQITPPFQLFDVDCDLGAFVESLPIDHAVESVVAEPGGTPAGRTRLHEFLARKLPDYAEGRNTPGPPEATKSSQLSAYLRNGHLSIEEVVAEVLATTGQWDETKLTGRKRNRKDEFYCDDINVNAFLDEAITWRDVGYLWHKTRRADATRLDTALPAWALATLRKHEADRREFHYELDEWEAAATHDELWNAAQRELRATGRIHNYMRMLWGKKVIEWSSTPAEAYATLEHLNNKYAVDGRDPNSYTGILWCFGLCDRPWPPERSVFGTVRYMSSASTTRKFDVKPYLSYTCALSPSEGPARPGSGCK